MAHLRLPVLMRGCPSALTSGKSSLRTITGTSHRMLCPVAWSRRWLSATATRNATPLYMLAALSHARETQHYAKLSGLGVTNHVPTLEAIKTSEVDPFADRKVMHGPTKTSPSTVSGSVPGDGRHSSSSSLFPTMADVIGEPPTVVTSVSTPPMASLASQQSVPAADAGNTQLALVALVVALVGMNAYFFEQLAGERREREGLAGRMQRLEQGGRAASARRARRDERRVSAAAARRRGGKALVSPRSDVPDSEVVITASDRGASGMGGFLKSLIWARE